MKDTVRDIFDKFGQSEPIFIGELASNSITFTRKIVYDPSTAEVDHADPVTKLMLANYTEVFERHGKKFVKSDHTVEATWGDIFNSLRRAFESASTLKKPEQSKLFHWLHRSNIASAEHREGVIALYRYIKPHLNKRSQFNDGPENIHAKNLIAILEKMKEKYEQ